MKSVLRVVAIAAGVLSMSGAAAGQSHGRSGGRVHGSASRAMSGDGWVVVTDPMPAGPSLPPSVGVVVPQTSAARLLFQPGLNVQQELVRQRGSGLIWYGYPFGLPYGYYGAYVGAGNPPQVPITQPPPPSNGYFVLQVEPRTAQVYVDGYYVGTVDDLNRNGGSLGAGPHQIEITAPGYEPLGVPVQITSGQTVTYRAAMQAVRPPVVEPTKPSSPQTFYVIPDCYLGDRPPNELVLPSGCDLSRVRTYSPQH